MQSMAGHFTSPTPGPHPAPKTPPEAPGGETHIHADHERLPNGQTHLVRHQWPTLGYLQGMAICMTASLTPMLHICGESQYTLSCI